MSWGNWGGGSPKGDPAAQPFSVRQTPDRVKSSLLDITDFGAVGNNDPLQISANDTAWQACIARAKQASDAGGVVRIYVPPGAYRISQSIQVGNIPGLAIEGDGSGSVINQATDNIPIFDYTSNQNINRNQLRGLRLQYINQQGTGNTSASAIRLYNSVAAGFNQNLFENLDIFFAGNVFEIGPTGGPTATAFWNNDIRNISSGAISGHLIASTNSTGLGGPVNYVERFTHITNWAQSTAQGGGGVGATPAAQTGFAFALPAGHQWQFTGCDVEDWFDGMFSQTGGGMLLIDDFHFERHRLYFNNGGGVMMNCLGSLYKVDGFHGSLYRDGTGPYSIHRVGVAALGADIGTQVIIDQGVDPTPPPGASQAGTVRVFQTDVDSPTSIGPRSYTGASIVDWLSTDTSYPLGIISDSGLPPVWSSATALPTPSATYQGRQIRVKGANASTADTLVQCMQSATGTFSWKVIATG